jgi:hypothetical protein
MSEGAMTDYAYENAQCPECGNFADDDSDNYVDVSGAPYGRPDLTDVAAHRTCVASRETYDEPFGKGPSDHPADQEMTCDCSDEHGPCEQHGDVLVAREGASLHTADELAIIEIGDLVSLGAELSVWGRAEYVRLAVQLEADRDATSGVAWFSDPDDGEAARALADQLESYVADLWIVHDDGYRIVRAHDDCPL